MVWRGKRPWQIKAFTCVFGKFARYVAVRPKMRADRCLFAQNDRHDDRVSSIKNARADIVTEVSLARNRRDAHPKLEAKP